MMQLSQASQSPKVTTDIESDLSPSKLGEFPSGPFGCVPNMIRDFLGFLDKAGKLGDLVEFSPLPVGMGGKNYLVTHPEWIYQLIVRENKSLWKGADTERVVAPALGKGLLMSEGEEHGRRKKLLQPGFTRASLEAYAPDIVSIADRAVSRWIDLGRVDLHKEMKRVTLEIVGKVFFGVDLANDTRMLEAMTDLDRVMQGRARYPIPGIGLVPFIAGPIPLRYQEPGVFRRINDLLQEIVEARRDLIRNSNETPSDLLSTILGEKAGLSDQEIRAELVTLFFAGHETTTTALTFFVYELLRNPDAFGRVRAEMDYVLGSELPSAESENQLKYMDAAMKENLRLNPPVPLFARSPLYDLDLGGHTIPEGSNILVSPWVTQRSERFFREPLEYRPQRFLQDGPAELKALANHSYFPFGLGPRACIGGPLAELEIKLVTATIFQRAEPAYDPAFLAEPVMRFTLDMRKPLEVTFSPRE